MTFRKTFVTLAAVFAMSAGTAGLVQAQETQAPEGTMAPDLNTQPGGADLDAEQISAFAVAYLEVNEIGMRYDEQITAAESEEQRTNLQLQASEEMTTAVENLDGITVDEYNQIFAAAQTDPAVAAQIEAEINAQMQ